MIFERSERPCLAVGYELLQGSPAVVYSIVVVVVVVVVVIFGVRVGISERQRRERAFIKIYGDRSCGEIDLITRFIAGAWREARIYWTCIAIFFFLFYFLVCFFVVENRR